MELLKIKEVARRLQVSESFAYELAARREIPTVIFGKAVRVPAEALEKWLSDHIEMNDAARTA